MALAVLVLLILKCITESFSDCHMALIPTPFSFYLASFAWHSCEHKGKR
jgi:hypothetical protein